MVSHSQLKLVSTPIERAEEIFHHLRPTPQVVGIDEVQFFGPEVVPVCEALADKGLRVICAGLDQDYQGRPFEPMPQLLAVAEYVTKELAICVVCGNPANRSQRLVARERAGGGRGGRRLRGALPQVPRAPTPAEATPPQTLEAVRRLRRERPMRDSLYENVPFRLTELTHRYGPQVHLVGNPFLALAAGHAVRQGDGAAADQPAGGAALHGPGEAGHQRRVPAEDGGHPHADDRLHAAGHLPGRGDRPARCARSR